MDILELIETYNDYLNKVPTGILKIASEFREGNIKNSLESVSDFSEGMLWLTKVKDYLIDKNVKVDFDEIFLKEYLSEINEGLKKEDYLLVADLFEYEIAPYFESLNIIKVEN